MGYQVFARKYRPQTFAEIIGQDHITKTLENAIRLNRIAQAYLLVGPRGTGKTSTARIIAKALNCPNGPRVDFDPKDPVCVEIAEGRSLDVIEIDGASNRNIDNIRELRESARYAPNAARFKIYYIDEVHMLTHEAFNALLKTLEEPPSHVKFIFATTEAHKVPATILSRCQRFDFRRIPEKLIADHLAYICKNEHVEASPEALRLLARHADGGLRDAEVALDQVISFYGSPITEEGVSEMFGLTGFAPIVALVEAIAQANVGAVLTQCRALSQAGRDFSRLSQDLMRLLRHIIVAQTQPDALKNEISEQERESILHLSRLTNQATVLEWMRELSQLEASLRYSLAKDILLEVTLLRLCHLQHKLQIEAVLSKLIQTSDASLSAEPGVQSTATNSSTSVSGHPSFMTPEQAWNKVVEVFAQERSLEREAILTLRYQGYENDKVVIRIPSALKHKLPFFLSPSNLDFVSSRLTSLLGKSTTVSYVVESETELKCEPKQGDLRKNESVPSARIDEAAQSTKPPGKISEEEFLKDPAIQKALEIFEGKIVNLKE
ncbi:MAG: DNA polymerase III subunit gamma/tau [Methylacidiphilales bacterium]|nr:DNA polymerase III subunit gamma/tau [Candidatus Methylacidiphilales bacterium]MDW8348951.1 DNA polymerase III subunit gamma/tau [Verrucomicrobiae bacterium]